MPTLGQPIPLSHQMLDGDDTKYVTAVLRRPDGTELAGSPYSLVNIGGGKYSLDTVDMPDYDYIECTYLSWEDAIHTIPDEDHLLGTDVFELTVPDSVIVEKLDLIISTLTSLGLPGAMVNVKVVQDTIKAAVEDIREVKALIDPSEEVSVEAVGESRTAVEVDENVDIVVKKPCS